MMPFYIPTYSHVYNHYYVFLILCFISCNADHQFFYKMTFSGLPWLRMSLPMQGTWVPSLVWEEPTCIGATKPVRYNYWACALQPTRRNCWSPRTLGPTCRNYWACMLQILKPMHLEPQSTREATAMRSPRTAMKSSPCSPQLEKARTQQEGPTRPKIKNK